MSDQQQQIGRLAMRQEGGKLECLLRTANQHGTADISRLDHGGRGGWTPRKKSRFHGHDAGCCL